MPAPAELLFAAQAIVHRYSTSKDVCQHVVLAAARRCLLHCTCRACVRQQSPPYIPATQLELHNAIHENDADGFKFWIDVLGISVAFGDAGGKHLLGTRLPERAIELRVR
jgi:hypothetical protein